MVLVCPSKKAEIYRNFTNYVQNRTIAGKWRDGAMECGVRNAECGVGKSLCLLVNGEVLALQNDCGCGRSEGGGALQKKGPIGALQKKNFSTPPKMRYFCTF